MSIYSKRFLMIFFYLCIQCNAKEMRKENILKNKRVLLILNDSISRELEIDIQIENKSKLQAILIC